MGGLLFPECPPRDFGFQRKGIKAKLAFEYFQYHIQTLKMDRFHLKCICVVFIVLAVLFQKVSTNSVDNPMDNNPNQNQEKYLPLIFRTKIKGRRISEKLADRNKLSEYLLEALDEYPWRVIAVNNNAGLEKRGNTHNFTPRLGRTLDESSTDDLSDITERNTAFSPRLGRAQRYNFFPTRLGKDESTNYH
ncbi:unnamed protein product [Ceutorhynchus assimilis]|uniref:Uncharacterized protein n=1 Tax=Ceutorhynchus assimilis TaxID=467358 RepID=A0A9N9M8B1_9CUCU|nr:unnamed protein product [Ceutorhynchus assimilis]